MTRAWSEYQKNIFDFVANGKGNGIVSAVAGSGKTTTIVEAMKGVSGSTLFLAFNKSIATELKLKGVNASTFHSLCYGPVTRFLNVRNVDSDKVRGLVAEYKAALDPRKNPMGLHKLDRVEFPMFQNVDNFWNYGSFATKLVGLARNMGVGVLIADEFAVWEDLVAHHDLKTEKGNVWDGIKFARELFRVSEESNLIDFDDLLYKAIKLDINLPQYDFVFVDEAQDTNPVQIAIIKKVVANGGRVIFVGDDAQAIYGFRGAGSDSMQLLTEAFDCVALPLTITYRCPVSVVEYAKRWVSELEAAPGAVDGEVQHLDTDWDPSLFEAHDMVVCRMSAPLVKLAYKCVKANKRVYIVGKEIGDSLKSLVKQMGASDIDTLVNRLNAYFDREIAKLDTDKDAPKIAALEDKQDALLFLCSILTENKRTVETLNASIDYLFAARDGATRMCTIHKAKGLEADNVFWLNSSASEFIKSTWAKQEWQKKQEDNLQYVAATRAKKALFLIEEERKLRD